MSHSNKKNETIDEEQEYYFLQKRVWDVLAPFYDFIVLPISGVRDRVVGFTNARSGSRILDVGTGTGKQAFAFAKKGYDVNGIDLSDAMLRVAIRENKYKNVRFEVADATKLPFANDSFDVSCISFAMHEMPLNIARKVLSEMVRVTKPNGTVVIVDYALPRNKIGRFLTYHFVVLWEGEYYSRFIKLDLLTFLQESGIKVKEELSVNLRTARILKGTPEKKAKTK